MTKEEYNELCKIYSEKQVNKEQNYQQVTYPKYTIYLYYIKKKIVKFFKDVADNQSVLQNQHADAVLRPLLAR